MITFGFAFFYFNLKSKKISQTDKTSEQLFLQPFTGTTVVFSDENLNKATIISNSMKKNTNFL